MTDTNAPQRSRSRLGRCSLRVAARAGHCPGLSRHSEDRSKRFPRRICHRPEGTRGSSLKFCETLLTSPGKAKSQRESSSQAWEIWLCLSFFNVMGCSTAGKRILFFVWSTPGSCPSGVVLFPKGIWPNIGQKRYESQANNHLDRLLNFNRYAVKSHSIQERDNGMEQRQEIFADEPIKLSHPLF